MLIKFFSKGQGGGAAPVDYLVAQEVLAYDKNRNVMRDVQGQPIMKQRDPLPEVLSGDPEITKGLIDSSTCKWSYRAGVIAFAEGDRPSEEQQRDVMAEFERLAFAGLEGNQYDILWVRHEHEGNVELHFCTPRMELTTGNSLNIAPPNYQKTYDELRDYLNKSHSWADPMDKSLQREIKTKRESTERAEFRHQLHMGLYDMIEGDAIADRDSMLSALKGLGFDINRQTEKSISIKSPELDKPMKLEGFIFEHDYTKEEHIRRALEATDGSGERKERRLDRWNTEELRERLERTIAKRSEYNRGRYQRAHEFDPHEIVADGGERQMDAARLDDRQLCGERDHPDSVEPLVGNEKHGDNTLRADGDLLEQRSGGAASDYSGQGEAQHHDMQSLWSRLLLPESEGGMNVTHAIGEGATRICQTAQRNIGRARNWLETRSESFEGLYQRLDRLADHIDKMRERVNHWLNNTQERVAGIRTERNELDASRETTEQATMRLERKLDNGLEL